MGNSSTLDFLQLHELLPLPPVGDLERKWTLGSLKDFLNRYLAFRRTEAAKFRGILGSGSSPSTLFLDPLDCGRPASFTQHLFLTERVVINDPITMIHCPDRPFAAWVKDLHRSLSFISLIQHLLRRDFVELVPDPRHCGLGEQAGKRAQDVLSNADLRGKWYESGHVCWGTLPAKITMGGTITVESPHYHLHLGSNTQYVSRFPDSPAIQAALKLNPSIHVDGRGTAQRFEKLTIRRAMTHRGLEEEPIKKFFLPHVTNYEASLLMAQMWAKDRFSTLNPLTADLLNRDYGDNSTAARDSAWIPPARCAVNALGLDASDPQHALDFRDANADAFRRYVKTLEMLSEEVKGIPADPNFANEVGAVVEKKIQPELRQLDAELRAAASAVKIYGGVFAAITLGGVALMVADPQQWSGAVTTALGALGTAASAAAEWRKAKIVADQKPLFFLWKAKKHGLLPEAH